MRRSERLNVVQSSAPYVNGNQNRNGECLPQNVPVFQTQVALDEENHAEQQDDNNLDIAGEEDEVERRKETTLPYVWNLPAGNRILVECNRLGQPIGKEGGVLGQFLGTVARNGGYCPLDKKDWRLVKKDDGDKTILQFVQTKFLYPRSCDKWILKSVGRDWRQYKAKLKKSLFNPKKKRSKLYRLCPPHVDEDQWVALIDLWKSKEGKILSEKNKASRGMRKSNHTAGTKSYARWSEDIRQEDPEKKEPHRAKVYLATHKEKSRQRDEHVVQLENLIEEQPELANNDHGRVAWEGDALHKVLGGEKPGQVHGMGLLPVPKQVYGQTSHHLKNVNITTLDGPSSEVDARVLKEVEKLHEHVKRQDKVIEELQNKQTCCTCHGNKEQGEVNFLTTQHANSQPQPVHSKRKRVQCDVPNMEMPSSEQEILRNNENHVNRENAQEDRVLTGTVKEHKNIEKEKSPCQDALSSCSAQNFPSDQFHMQKGNSVVHKKKTLVQSKNKKQKQQLDTMTKKSHVSAMKCGTTVLLKTAARYPNKMAVAYATFLSSDPDEQVGGAKLGNQFWKVRVNYPLEGDDMLARPLENCKTIGQVKGKAIAWPSFCVEKVNG